MQTTKTAIVNGDVVEIWELRRAWFHKRQCFKVMKEIRQATSNALAKLLAVNLVNMGICQNYSFTR